MTLCVLFGLAEAICVGSEAWVAICRDQCRLEHHVPQGTATAGDGLFPAQGCTVVRDRSRPSEWRSLFPGEGGDLGCFGDQHSAGNRSSGPSPIEWSGLCLSA